MFLGNEGIHISETLLYSLNMHAVCCIVLVVVLMARTEAPICSRTQELLSTVPTALLCSNRSNYVLVLWNVKFQCVLHMWVMMYTR